MSVTVVIFMLAKTLDDEALSSNVPVVTTTPVPTGFVFVDIITEIDVVNTCQLTTPGARVAVAVVNIALNALLDPR